MSIATHALSTKIEDLRAQLEMWQQRCRYLEEAWHKEIRSVNQVAADAYEEGVEDGTLTADGLAYSDGYRDAWAQATRMLRF